MNKKVNKLKNHSAIRLPQHNIKDQQLNHNDALDYKMVDEKIKVVSELTIETLFENYVGEPVNTSPLIFESIANEKW
ncbi:MAG: hypothetical protein Q4F01_03170 [Staphylococcus rostri]|uniref:hypothetical protein n=1 Tax=Staphylococcus rostri TaxID=522262 RepID=UPI0026E068DA|nr:hypothetical protein [Staphylococcus rostri]MDO5375165.1 hypothetical protein [Staphylococcus rostri]